MKKFEIKGDWFLPASRDKRAYGVLSFDPHEGTSLELYGSFSDDSFLPEFQDQEIILGLASDSKQVTLYNCSMTKSGGATLVQGEESGRPSTKYSIRYILVGTHVDNASELVFDKISAEIFNLGEWVGISGFKNNVDFERMKNREVVVEYKLPEPIEFDIAEDVRGKFNFFANQPGLSRYQKTVTINQRVELQIVTSVEKDIDSLLKYVFTFQNFLTLALYRSTYPISISLSGESHKKDYGDGEPVKKSIRLYFSSRAFKSSEEPKLDLNMIFSYRGISDFFPSVIESWYSKYELLEPAFDLVFEQFYNDGFFSVNTFLNLAQSAETFHARVHNHTKIPRDEYKKMKEFILSATPAEYHTWLNDQFNFGNNLNLHLRLTEIAEKYSNSVLDKIIPNKQQFVLDVKNSRNYYTHYSKGGEKKALKGGDLFYLSERLKILLVCAFLMEAGFDGKKLEPSLDNVKWKLFNHLANWREA